MATKAAPFAHQRFAALDILGVAELVLDASDGFRLAAERYQIAGNRDRFLIGNRRLGMRVSGENPRGFLIQL